jgi:hypothetical protein
MVEPLLSGIVLGMITVTAFSLQHSYNTVVEISSKSNFVKILQIKICKVLIKLKFNYFLLESINISRNIKEIC